MKIDNLPSRLSVYQFVSQRIVFLKIISRTVCYRSRNMVKFRMSADLQSGWYWIQGNNQIWELLMQCFNGKRTAQFIFYSLPQKISTSLLNLVLDFFQCHQHRCYPFETLVWVWLRIFFIFIRLNKNLGWIIWQRLIFRKKQ